MAIGFVGAAAALVGAIVTNDIEPEAFGWCVIGTVAGVVLGVAMIPLYNAASKLLNELRSLIAEKKRAAWKLMAPLNRLFTWDVTVKLIEATVPRLKFDPYFAADRLDELHRQFDWDDSFNDGKSIIFAQSGVINGNPFVFGQYLDMEWGEKTYEGTKDISWTEWEEDEDGKSRPVRRHETLHAYVTKPIPVYSERKLLLFGNDAAPNLSFSREPSGLSGGGLCDSIKKKWRLCRLKAYSRNLDDDSDFTLMGNHEFETWFHAKDRDHEVEFRLLFTPVAQMQMLNLMKDKVVGYGDDFTFIKQKKINVLYSEHLDKATIDTDPARFRNWDYDAAASIFISFNERYFKDAYFALAPLLSIPLRCTAATAIGTKCPWNGSNTSRSTARATCVSAKALRHPTNSRTVQPPLPKAPSAARSFPSSRPPALDFVGNALIYFPPCCPGRLAQLVRALPSHGRGHWSESSIAHHVGEKA